MVNLVERSHNYRAQLLIHQFFVVETAKGVIVVCRGFAKDSVSVRKTEHHYISTLHAPETLEPVILVLNKCRIGLFTECGIVSERDGERSLRHLRTVCQFAYEKMVSGIESLFH